MPTFEEVLLANKNRNPQEEKLAQIASLIGNRQPQSQEELQNVPVVQPEGMAPAGSDVALGEVGQSSGITDTGEDLLANEQSQPEYYKMMIEQLRDRERRAKPLIQEERQGLNEYASKIKNFENQQNQVNVAPILNWLDSNYGSNLSKGYERPMNEQEKLAKIATMYKDLQGSREKMIDDALRAGGDSKLVAQLMLAGGRNEAANKRLQDRNDFAAHKSVVTSIKNDPTQKAQLTQLRNLDNSASAVLNSKALTTQQIDEFQQAVRANLGIKGTSGVGEREKTMLNSLGYNVERMVQFLTGEPAQIAKDDKLVAHIKELAGIEAKNVKDQLNERLNVLSEGFGSVYDRRPDLKKDLDRLLKSTKGQYETKTLSVEPKEQPETYTPKSGPLAGKTLRLNKATGQYEE